MKCDICGTEIREGARFCTTCGVEVQAMQPQYGTPYNNQNPYGYPNQQPAMQYQSNVNKRNTYYPMKWFHFLIYFYLFFMALNFVSDGMSYLTGAEYEVKAVKWEMEYGEVGTEMIQILQDEMSLVDKISGVVCFLLAPLCIVTRFQLAGFKKNGPKLWYLVLGVTAILDVVYVIAQRQAMEKMVANISNSQMFLSVYNGALVVVVIFAVVRLLLNVKYFNRRWKLFEE